ncbi:hypothetical protein [uncultured Gilliamella sp.]|uniref:hypothetical protein n=1 Tax=uncultured Gilliamella sp. TaxID=1193505 RepID=UPI0025DEEDFE|nr:hypothetical protein [uncultured Gilliamella sp.]
MIKDDLFQDKTGNLDILSHNNDLKPRYLSTITHIETTYPLKEIDTESYEHLGAYFYAQDNHHFYYNNGNSLKTVTKIPCLKESADYKKIKDNLYRNMNNNLFIRSVDSTTVSCPKCVYIEVSNIDANSYEKLENSNYFKENSRLIIFKRH